MRTMEILMNDPLKADYPAGTMVERLDGSGGPGVIVEYVYGTLRGSAPQVLVRVRWTTTCIVGTHIPAKLRAMGRKGAMRHGEAVS